MNEGVRGQEYSIHTVMGKQNDGEKWGWVRGLGPPLPSSVLSAYHTVL
jgi:hypothetical protein